jgi:hypothetical protein
MKPLTKSEKFVLLNALDAFFGNKPSPLSEAGLQKLALIKEKIFAEFFEITDSKVIKQSAKITLEEYTNKKKREAANRIKLEI